MDDDARVAAGGAPRHERRVGMAVSAMSSTAPSAPPSAVISFSTTDVAETWFSPTAAYSAVTSA